MCIFVFSRKNDIQLEYVSETGILGWKGSLDVVIDLLITNKSDDPLKKLYIIVPHNIFESTFKDISTSLLDPGSIYNKQKDPLERIETKEIEGATEVSLITPNPHNTEKDSTYVGVIAGASELNIYKDLSERKKNILEDLNMTLLTCDMKIPMDKNNPRWFRWKFTVPKASLNKRNKMMYCIDYFRNRLEYYFEIIGPLSVRDNFFKTMANFQRLLDEKRRAAIKESDKKDYDEILLAHHELMRDVWIDGISQNIENSVRIIDWRVIVFPDLLKTLRNIQLSGDVTVFGTYPNWLQSHFHGKGNRPKTQKFVAYEWRSGYINVGSKTNNPGNFNVKYTTNHEPLLIPYMPLFAVLLSFCAFILSIIRFCI